FAVEAEDVDIGLAHPHHLLLLGELPDRLDLVAVLRRLLVAHLLRRAAHALLERLDELSALAGEERLHVVDGLAVLLLRAEASHARAEAPFDVVLEARTVELAVDLDLARAQHEVLVDELERLVRDTGRQERAEVARSVVRDTTHEHGARERLVRDLD